MRYGYYKGGNLKNIYDGEDTVSFVYNNGDGIADRLMVYDGQLLSYDEIGNPLKFRDGISMTWKNGRQLATLTNGQTSASYDYDESGIRTKKTVNGITTTYQLDGSKIVSENRNGNIIQYYYNEAGSVIGLRYNGNDYFFRRTVQGDIIAILNTSGEVVVTYEYDPWGNILSTSGSMAATLGADNPFRYRGYYYDNESGFYYLQSRYYDPVTGRFLNADDTAYLGVTETTSGYNLFSYCENNVVNYCDYLGFFKVVRAVVSVPIDVILSLLSPYLAPIKAAAKKFAGAALKSKLATPLISLIKFIAKVAGKLLTALKSIVNKIPFVGRKWARLIDVNKISSSIAGAVTSGVFNFILNKIVPNISIFLSVGGFVAGLLDLLSDGKLDNRIVIPFSR